MEECPVGFQNYASPIVLYSGRDANIASSYTVFRGNTVV
jgi:hypothetical protein